MHLEQITLIVDDYDRAIRFYVDVLGFELVEDSPSLTGDGQRKRWVVVRPPGATSGLLLAEADGERNRTRWENSSRTASGCSCGSMVRAGIRVHRNMGVEFITEPRHEPYGQFVVFTDIAGSLWDLLGPRQDR